MLRDGQAGEAELTTGQPATQVSQIPNIPLTSFRDVLPTYDVIGLQQLGPPANGNANFATSVTQFIDSYSWVKGRHSLKVGAEDFTSTRIGGNAQSATDYVFLSDYRTTAAGTPASLATAMP